MNLLFEHSRLPPPIQFFQPFSHFMSARFTHIAMLTVRMVDSQKGQQVASQLHDHLAEFRLLASGGCCVRNVGNCSSQRREHYATRRGCRLISLYVFRSIREERKNHSSSGSFRKKIGSRNMGKPAAQFGCRLPNYSSFISCSRLSISPTVPAAPPRSSCGLKAT